MVNRIFGFPPRWISSATRNNKPSAPRIPREAERTADPGRNPPKNKKPFAGRHRHSRVFLPNGLCRSWTLCLPLPAGRGRSGPQRTAPVPGASSTPPAVRGLAALPPIGPGRSLTLCIGFEYAERDRRCGFSVVRCRLSVVGCRFSVVGCLLSVVCCRFGRPHTRGVNLNTRNAQVGNQKPETRNQKPQVHIFSIPIPISIPISISISIPVTLNLQPSTFNPQPTTNNRQPTTDNRQPATDNFQPATHNPQPSTFKRFGHGLELLPEAGEA